MSFPLALSLNAPCLAVVSPSPSPLKKKGALDKVGHFFTAEGAGDVYYSLKDKFVTPSQLGQDLRQLAKNPKFITHSNYQKSFIRAFKSKEYSQSLHFIQKILCRMSDKQIDQTIKALFDSYAEENPKPLIKKLMGLFTLQKIEKIIKCDQFAFDSVQDYVDCHADIVKKSYKEKAEEEKQTLFRTAKAYFINTIDYIVNLFMNAFNLKNLDIDDGDPGEAHMQAMTKYLNFKENISLVLQGLTLLAALVGSTLMTAGLAVGIATSSIAVGVIYFKWLKPCPEYVPPFKNMVMEAMKGELAPVYGRDTEVQELIKILCSNTSSTVCSKGVLVGDSGSGKTQIAHKLAHLIAAKQVPDELKDLKLFYVNTSQLLTTQFSRAKTLERALFTLKGYESRCIFFFDELHCAFNTKKAKELGEKLKTLFDPGPSGLKYCFGATTLTEFASVASDSAFRRRLHRIDVVSMGDEETKTVLRETTEKEASDIIIADKALQKVAEVRKTNPVFATMPQPYISKKILTEACERVRKPDQTENQRILHQLVEKERDLRSQYKRLVPEQRMGAEGLAIVKDRKEVKDNIKKYRKLADQDEASLKKIHGLIKRKNQLQKKCDLKAMLFVKLTATEQELKKFALKQFYLMASFQRTIQGKSQQFEKTHPNIYTAVSENLIQTVIEKEEHIIQQRKGERI